MQTYNEGLSPALASLLIALQEGKAAIAELQMDDVIALGRERCIHFDNHGHLVLTPRGHETVAQLKVQGYALA